MGLTAIEKVLARTSGKDTVRPGDIAVCRPDLVVQADLLWANVGAWHRPKKIFDADRVVQLYDHAIPAPTILDASGQAEARRFAKQFKLKKHFDIGRGGISHVIVAENRLARPGELLVCSDSHTCACGAFNCAGRGVGLNDLLQALTKGLVWYPVVPTIRYEFKGSLPPVVSGKDVFFHIANTFGAHTNHNIEFGGAGIKALDMSARRTISTMCPEVGAEFAMFECDDITREFLKGGPERPIVPADPDADADYADVRTIDLADVEPYVIMPHSVPKNGARLSTFDRKIPINQAFVGSCANGQIEDFRVVAKILRGRKVAPDVRFIVTPGSQAIYLQALREGLLEPIIEAGAIVTNSTCGACYGGHMGLVGPGEVCITASTRNFKGRMGSSDAEIYMGSPATVAASAVAGVITDPRTLWQ